MISCVVRLMGTASPRPTPATAVLMPITRPRLSANAPPEFPGLRAASVWITSSISRAAVRERAGMLRPRPLTTPAVTVPDSDHQGSDEQRVRVAVLGRGRYFAVRSDDGEVRQRIPAEHAELGRGPI